MITWLANNLFVPLLQVPLIININTFSLMVLNRPLKRIIFTEKEKIYLPYFLKFQPLPTINISLYA